MVYIGITSIEPEKRWRNGLGYWQNKHFYNAIKKYNWNKFEHTIIASELTQEEAENMEREYINKYNSTNRLYGYNIELGGNSFGKHSEEVRKKISLANGKPIICAETNEMYHSTTEAMNITRIKTIKKHLLGEYEYAGMLSDGTKLHWRYCTEEEISNGEYCTKSIAISTLCVVVNGVSKKSGDLTLDDLIVLFSHFIKVNNRTPLMRECTIDNNLPQQRVINKILNDNNITYNDFMLVFGKSFNVKLKTSDYNYYVGRFKEVSKQWGRSLTQKELSSNTYGLPNAIFFVKHCPSNSVKTYTDFVKWCGLIPSVKYFDKNMVGQNLIKLEKKLNRPIKANDITTDNCGFSYQLVKKYYDGLVNAKHELNLS